MFFEKESISFNILDVLEVKQKNTSLFNSDRNFNALSYRFHADTKLTTSKNEYHVADNSVCYVPARLNYMRTSNFDDMVVVHFETINYTALDIEFFTPQKPIKDTETSQWINGGGCMALDSIFEYMMKQRKLDFDFIKWKDTEPWKVADLLELEVE